MFFLTFHLTRRSSIKKYWILLGIFEVINVWTYVVLGNILPQMLVHGLAGSILFTEFTDHDEIKDRLG
ncbi:MAG: hypothetical protein UU16_C0037G0009 [Candidatus Woesebacteria bacterium GW2011_GWA2_40_7]|uniref:Uncharacterized protein n=1 Tax=Candidatus Woesebacteria bacterium GW2011_GWA2_40_7 TaxID=1618562 RepID=A0A0G0T6W3_9BACT|nr:MAG: hypothetical protein UU16_C0037G0009 [Candidatus Woesebacteria bacterium GW2011_GWA2_40_7]